METLPGELISHIKLFLDYTSLNNFSSCSRIYSVTEMSFWQNKCIRDFDVSDKRFTEINKTTGNARDTYLWLTGISGVPIPGGERFGNVWMLCNAAVLSNNFSLIKYYYKLYRSSRMFYYLAIQNQEEYIDLLLGEYSCDRSYLEIVFGAATTGNEKLFYRFADDGWGNDYRLEACTYAVKSGNISLVKFLLESITDTCLAYVGEMIRYAVEGNYLDILEYILDRYNHDTFYEEAIAEATNKLDWNLMKFLGNRSNLSPNRKLRSQTLGAAKRGYLYLVKELLFQTDVNLDEVMEFASSNHQWEIVVDMLNRGASNLSPSLHAGIRDKRIVKLLVERGAPVDHHCLGLAIRYGNMDIFLLLYSHSPDSWEFCCYSAAYYGNVEVLHYFMIHEGRFFTIINKIQEDAIVTKQINVIYFLAKYAHRLDSIYESLTRKQSVLLITALNTLLK